MTIDHLAKRICQFLERPNPVLFAGAGVGSRVGLPTWGGYMEALAAACDQFSDGDSASLIRKRAENGNFLGAATVFKTCEAIPEGERWKALADPFKGRLAESRLGKLRPLFQFGFGAIITTNYDVSLHDAYCKFQGRFPIPIERPTLRAGGSSRDFFIARVHGNAEQPLTMAVDAIDYKALDGDNDYQDFLCAILQTRSCLFLGFSFLDPAINQVLQLYAERFGPTYQSLHTAIIPTGQVALETRLHALNIETLTYNSGNDHADMWSAIAQAAVSRTPQQAGAPTRFDFGHEPMHKFVAFAYAQANVKPAARSIVSIAQDGLVESKLSEFATDEVSEEVIVAEVSKTLRLPEDQARRIVSSSLGRLADRDQVLRDQGKVIWFGSQHTLDSSLARLANDVADRMRVREGVKADERDLRAIKLVLERALMSRAWDLAAHFAGGNSGWSTDLSDVVQDSIGLVSAAERPRYPSSIDRSVQALFRAPDREEAQLLTSLGRAAFGIQLLLSSPRQTLFHQYALPQVLYLDANVLMPAITSGHPLRPIYHDVIKRLSDAADKAQIRLDLVVGEQFLNEIVSHRQLATEIVRRGALEAPENLRRHIGFHSALNTNVFVGAYATFVGRQEKPITFSEFLKKAAPYEDERSLEEYLRSQGIQARVMDFRKQNNSDFVAVFNPLSQAYEEATNGILQGKEKVLVQHEALQLTQLSIDSKAGIRSLFVTADRRLRRALLANTQLRSLAALTMSHLGLAALVDVMVGLTPDAGSLARLIWAAPKTDDERALFEYFVNLGLRRYEEGLQMELQAVAEASTKEAIEAVASEGISFTENPDEVEKSSAFLDRFQDRFFQNWREAIERRDRHQN